MSLEAEPIDEIIDIDLSSNPDEDEDEIIDIDLSSNLDEDDDEIIDIDLNAVQKQKENVQAQEELGQDELDIDPLNMYLEQEETYLHRQ